jgi:CheY-like chemotaxis protein
LAPPKRLLLVDDQPEVALVVRRFCKPLGCHLASCVDVPSAWELLGRQPIDLLILDRNLPGESGLELCRRVRATPGLAKLLVALLGHWDLPDDIVAALEVGVDYVLSKELLRQPCLWQNRIHEVFLPDDGRPYRRFLSWKQRLLPVELLEKWLDALNRGLHSQALRIGDRVMQVLIRRAVQRSGTGPVVLDLVSRNCSFDVERLPRLLGPDGLIRLTSALAEQLWCVGGTAASEPFCTSLVAAVPALAECSPE